MLARIRALATKPGASVEPGKGELDKALAPAEMRLAAPSACTTGCASICPTIAPQQAMAAPASLPTWGALTDPNLARDSYFATERPSPRCGR